MVHDDVVYNQDSAGMSRAHHVPQIVEAAPLRVNLVEIAPGVTVKFPAGVRVKTHVNYTLAVVNVPEKEEVVVVAAPVAGAAVPGEAAPAVAGGKPADGKTPAPAAGDAKGGAAPKAAAPAAPGKKDDKKK